MTHRTILSATPVAALLLVAALTGCQNPKPAENDTASSPRESAPTGTPLADETQMAAEPTDTQSPHSEPRNCRFEVDGKTLLDGQCLVFPMGDGGYTLNTWTDGKPEKSHFAVVIANADGSAEASWNADPDDDKAMDPLGQVALQQGCWVNQRTRICAK